MKIDSQHVTTFCRCNTSSRLHSRAALRDSLFNQSLAFVKQSLERNTKVDLVMSQISLLLTLALSLSLVSCVKRSHQQSASAIGPNSDELSQNKPERININTAPESELEKLPGIGKGLAERIVDHREKYGPFRRAEHLIILRGLSDRRFRALRELITVE